MAAPIPRRLLIHSGALHYRGQPDGWGGAQASDIPLQFVRVEPSSSWKHSKDSDSIQAAATLFFDAHNSLPQGMDFTGMQGITADVAGQHFRVISVDALYDEHGLHHWELGLA